jgi:hypothetical protein
MSNSAMPLNHDALATLLDDLVIVRIVTVVNFASLSILELLEYGLARKDIGRAITKEVIAFDNPIETAGKALTAMDILIGEDFSQEMLRKKVRLTELGLYILEVVEESSNPQAGRIGGGDKLELHNTAGDPFGQSPHL